MSSSFSVLNDVDDQTSKAVLGSDGAARWQTFREEGGRKINATSSVAPAIPLKRLDRALGTKSISDERAAEARIRRDAGDRELGSGYTEFKRKNDHEEIAAEKKRKLILDRCRPDEMPYFLAAETFEGWKFDYVFSAKSRGIGYYWDGWDSMKRELGEEQTAEDTSSKLADDPRGDKDKSKTKSKKKKRRKIIQETVVEDDSNPMEQVAQALRRKQAALNTNPLQSREVSVSDAVALGAMCKTVAKESLPDGWESASDPTSGKTYYFCRSTGQRSWTKPVSNDKKVRNENNDGKDLPEGWKSAKDTTSSNIYYYHSDGRTSWTKPTCS